MSRLLQIQWVDLAPRLVHGRRPDRPAPRPPGGATWREGPLWNREPDTPVSPSGPEQDRASSETDVADQP